MVEFQNPDHWDTAAQHYEKTAHPFTARYAEAALARVALTSNTMSSGQTTIWCRWRSMRDQFRLPLRVAIM